MCYEDVVYSYIKTRKKHIKTVSNHSCISSHFCSSSKTEEMFNFKEKKNYLRNMLIMQQGGYFYYLLITL